MGGLFWNKVFGAALAAALIIFGIRELSHSLVHPHVPDHPGYAIAIEENTGAGKEAAAAVIEVSLAELLMNASASSGQRVAKKCAACHTFDQGGANKTGPNLWNIVGRAAASYDGFGYSPAMKASGLTWDFETLNTYLTKPKDLVPKTAMSFAGLKKAKDRANLLAWIREKADTPTDFPAFVVPVTSDLEHSAKATAQQAQKAMAQVKETVTNVADQAHDAVQNVVKEMDKKTGGDHH